MYPIDFNVFSTSDSSSKLDFSKIIIFSFLQSKSIFLASLIYLLDYASIYKAVLDEIDPSPVKSIDFVKREMS